MDKCSPLLVSRIQNAFKSDDSEGSVAELFYRPILLESLQIGPTCGFFALEAAGNFLLNSEIRMDSLLSYAREMGFTNAGECFSAHWLADTARHFFGDRMDVSVCDFFSFPTLARQLIDGNSLFMVPYDCDKNFEPCNRCGQSAHWAVVCGFVFSRPSSRPSSNEGVINSAPIRWFSGDSSTLDLSSAKNFYVIAYHGKSRHPALWSYDVLRASNSQLNEADGRRTDEFRLPKGADSSLSELRDKCVLLKYRQ